MKENNERKPQSEKLEVKNYTKILERSLTNKVGDMEKRVAQALKTRDKKCYRKR